MANRTHTHSYKPHHNPEWHTHYVCKICGFAALRSAVDRITPHLVARIVLSILIALAVGACLGTSEPTVLVSLTPAHPADTAAAWATGHPDLMSDRGPVGAYVRSAAWAWDPGAADDDWIQAGIWAWQDLGVAPISDAAAAEDLPACSPQAYCGSTQCRLDLVVTRADFPGAAIGWWVGNGWGPEQDIAWIMLDPRLLAAERQSVVAHELGHVLGLEHLPDESLSLMSSTNRLYAEAQSDDYAAAWALCEEE